MAKSAPHSLVAKCSAQPGLGDTYVFNLQRNKHIKNRDVIGDQYGRYV